MKFIANKIKHYIKIQDTENILYDDIIDVIVSFVDLKKILHNKEAAMIKKEINLYIRKPKFQSFYKYKFYRVNNSHRINGFYKNLYYPNDGSRRFRNSPVIKNNSVIYNDIF